MRTPKGFGKNYFTLAAIQATVAQLTMHSQSVSMQPALHVNFDNNEDIEDDQNDELLSCNISNTLKDADCSCHCTHFSRIVIKDKSIQNCYIAQFLRTDSVSSPPQTKTYLQFKIKSKGKI